MSLSLLLECCKRCVYVYVVMLLIKRTGRADACTYVCASVCPAYPVGLPSVHSAVNQLVLVAISVTIVRCLATHSVSNCVRVCISISFPVCVCVFESLTPWSHAPYGSLANSTRAQINFATSTLGRMQRLSALVLPYSPGSECSTKQSYDALSESNQSEWLYCKNHILILTYTYFP